MGHSFFTSASEIDINWRTQSEKGDFDSHLMGEMFFCRIARFRAQKAVRMKSEQDFMM